MSWLFHLLLFWVFSPSGKHPPDRDRELLLEVLALRHQLCVLQRKLPKPRFSPGDRWLWAWISKQWREWKRACVLVKPETVIRWHRLGFRLFWKWKSRKRTGRPTIDPRTIGLIRRLAKENPTWGGSRIHGELAKLGVLVSEATVHRYAPKPPPTPKQSQSWKTFLENHREVITAMDYIVVPTWNFKLLYALVIVKHGRRLVTHVNVTAHPTAEWVKQQLREAFPFDELPKYLIHDRDAVFCSLCGFIRSFGIKPKMISFRSPWQNGTCERMMGTLRRELLDHVIVRNEDHLRRLLRDFVRYYHEDRPHLSLAKDTPKGRPVERPPNGTFEVKAHSRLGGLHHRYTWRDAA